MRNLVRLCPLPFKTPLWKALNYSSMAYYSMWHVRSSVCETNITAPSFKWRFDDKWRCSPTHCLLSTHEPSSSFIHEPLWYRCDCYADFVCYLQRAVNNAVRERKAILTMWLAGRLPRNATGIALQLIKSMACALVLCLNYTMISLNSY